MNLVLIGYMASGKSIIGQELAKKLSYEFVDLDAFIEKQESRTIKDIFSTFNELYFRKKEKEHLATLLQHEGSKVIALGGGTPCYYDTIDKLVANENFTTIYLNVSIPVLVARLKNEKLKRPLVAHIDTDEELTEFIGKHLFERSLFYNKAEIKINANNLVDKVVEDIVAELF